MTREEIAALEADEIETNIQNVIKDISAIPEKSKRIYHGPGIYFVVHNERIYEISDDASCSPKGGWFPDIVTGLSDGKRDYIEKLMKKWDIDESVFADFLDWCMESFEPEEMIEYFEENEEDKLPFCKSILAEYENGKTPFDTLFDFVEGFERYELEHNLLYYKWEGMYIEFYDNIVWTGEPRGEYDRISSKEWLFILMNIESYVVEADR